MLQFVNLLLETIVELLHHQQPLVCPDSALRRHPAVKNKQSDVTSALKFDIGQYINMPVSHTMNIDVLMFECGCLLIYHICSTTLNPTFSEGMFQQVGTKQTA